MRTLLIVAALFAASPALSDIQTYGDLGGDMESVRIGKVLNDPERFVDKAIRVEGLVDDVCPKKGCWVEILDAQSKETLRVKVQDDVIVFPVEAKGSKIVAEGILRKHELTREQAVNRMRHLAEEKGEPFDESTVTGPMVVYQVEGIGAAIGE